MPEASALVHPQCLSSSRHNTGSLSGLALPFQEKLLKPHASQNLPLPSPEDARFSLRYEGSGMEGGYFLALRKV